MGSATKANKYAERELLGWNWVSAVKNIKIFHPNLLLVIMRDHDSTKESLTMVLKSSSAVHTF